MPFVPGPAAGAVSLPATSEVTDVASGLEVSLPVKFDSGDEGTADSSDPAARLPLASASSATENGASTETSLGNDSPGASVPPVVSDSMKDEEVEDSDLDEFWETVSLLSDLIV